MKNLNTVLRRIKEGSKAGKDALLQFAFPSYCLHCHLEKVLPNILFCHPCQDLIELADIEEPVKTAAAVLKGEGAALSLLKALKTSSSKEAIKTISSLMIFQIRALKWPAFDRLLASPKEPLNQKIAQNLSALLQVPLANLKESLESRTILVIDCKGEGSNGFPEVELLTPKKVFWLALYLPPFPPPTFLDSAGP